MSQESFPLSTGASSCLIIGYRNETFVLRLHPYLKELMRNDIDKLLRQEGVELKQWPYSIQQLTQENLRLIAGNETENKEDTNENKRRIYTKHDEPVRVYKSPTKKNELKPMESRSSSLLGSMTHSNTKEQKSEVNSRSKRTKVKKQKNEHNFSDMTQSIEENNESSEIFKHRLSELEKNFARIVESFNKIKKVMRYPGNKNSKIPCDLPEECLTNDELCEKEDEISNTSSNCQAMPETNSIENVNENVQKIYKSVEELQETISNQSSICMYCANAVLPKSGRDVGVEICRITKGYNPADILLAVVTDSTNYHLNVFAISTGLCLGCVMATADGFNHSETQVKLAEFVTFYVSHQNCERPKENVKNIGAFFEYIRAADKKKRHRDIIRNKRTSQTPRD